MAGGHLLHIEALVNGGLNEKNNIKLACNSCHKDLHAQKAKRIRLEQAFEKSNWSLFSHFEILNIAKEHNQKVLIEYVDENGEITTRWILIMDFKYEIQHGDRIWIISIVYSGMLNVLNEATDSIQLNNLQQMVVRHENMTKKRRFVLVYLVT